MGRRTRDPVAVLMGKQMRRARQILDLSQREVADDMGVVEGVYGSWERGWRKVPVDKLPDLSRVLRKPVGYFYAEPDPAGLTDYQRTVVQLTLEMDKTAQASFLSVGQQLAKASRRGRAATQ